MKIEVSSAPTGRRKKAPPKKTGYRKSCLITKTIESSAPHITQSLEMRNSLQASIKGKTPFREEIKMIKRKEGNEREREKIFCKRKGEVFSLFQSLMQAAI